jgi:hypothetical protein
MGAAPQITVCVLEDMHTFTSDDGTVLWSGGYAPIDDEGRFLTLAEHETPYPRVLYCRVAGVSYRADALQDARFVPLSQVILRPEPENPHDRNAVGIWDLSGTVQVGYVPADLSPKVAAGFRADQPLSGLIVREIRRESATGPRVALHLLLAPPGALNLRINSDEDNSEDTIDDE